MSRSFNGTSDYISGSSASPTAISVAAWVNAASFPASYNAVVMRWYTTSVVWKLLIKSNGKLYVGAYTNTLYQYDGTGAYTLSTGTWYHVGFSYSSAQGALIGYVNGAQDNSVSASSNLDTLITSPVYMGKDEAATGRWWHGNIADVGIWTSALTQKEFASLATGARPSQIRPQLLSSYWPLDGLVSPEPDFSGYANNGTLTGTSLAAGPPLSLFTRRRPYIIPGAAVNPSGTVAQTLFKPSQGVIAFTGNVVTQKLFAPIQSITGTFTSSTPSGTVVQTLLKPKQLVAATSLTTSTDFSSYWTQAP